MAVVTMEVDLHADHRYVLVDLTAGDVLSIKRDPAFAKPASLMGAPGEREKWDALDLITGRRHPTDRYVVCVRSG